MVKKLRVTRKRRHWQRVVCCFALTPLAAAPVAEDMPDAREFMAAVIDESRGQTSYAELTMVVTRPDWTRTSKLVAWTKGRDKSLVRFTAPPREAGNAFLTLDDRIWTWSARIGRRIRLPTSLMSQSWAGSDLSYSDLARSDDRLDHYRFELSPADASEIDVALSSDQRIYRIDATPLDNAPVVWGKEALIVRADHVLLRQVFFDQSMQPVKRIETMRVDEVGSRVFASDTLVEDLEESGHTTRLVFDVIEFDTDISDEMFTTFELAKQFVR